MTCLLEMAFAGNCGLEVDLTSTTTGLCSSSSDLAALETLFNEDLGLVMEVLPHNEAMVKQAFIAANVPCVSIGRVGNLQGNISVTFRGEIVLCGSVSELRDVWESTSFALEREQCSEACVVQERESMLVRRGPTYRLTFDRPILSYSNSIKPRVAIIRQEGTNGDREMATAFHMAGFESWDVNMRDLLEGRVTLDRFRGVAFCGGFSYADVTGSAKGWAGVIRFNKSLWNQFEAFRLRRDTFSLGVCNGCQLMTLLGWVPGEDNALEDIGSSDSLTNQDLVDPQALPDLSPRLVHNTSGRFESRWVTVRVMPSPAILLKGMEDSVLGVWSAHGEGKVYFPADHISQREFADDGASEKVRCTRHLQRVKDNCQAPIRYVDDSFLPTTAYPMNPNGSPDGIAGLCSVDGRHLAIMPHPERCFLQWQWPYMPVEWRCRQYEAASVGEPIASPWMKLFENAFDFCHPE